MPFLIRSLLVLSLLSSTVGGVLARTSSVHSSRHSVHSATSHPKKVVKRKSGTRARSHSFIRSAKRHLSKKGLKAAKTSKSAKAQAEAGAPEPRAENVQDGQSLNQVYHLYDQGGKRPYCRQRRASRQGASCRCQRLFIEI